MKYTITATAIVFATIAFTGTPSRATLSGQYLWQGDFFITAATPQCSSEGKNVGAFGQMVFQPKKLPGNDPNQDKLVIFPSWKLSAMQWVSNTPSTSGLLNGATSVTMTGVDASGAYSNSKTVKSLTVAQSAVDDNTFGSHFADDDRKQRLHHYGGRSSGRAVLSAPAIDILVACGWLHDSERTDREAVKLALSSICARVLSSPLA